jgi:hypothetical protein
VSESTYHRLKTWPGYFQAIVAEVKTFELRQDDRPYAVGDRLILQEYDPEVRGYTGASAGRTVTYVLRGPEAEQFGLSPGYCILGLARESPCPACDTQQGMR